MKKLLAMVLALVMTLSLAVSANAFKDDKSISDDYAEAVAVLNGMGVFKGYEDGSFQPKGDITRAEVSAIVYRVYTQDVKDAKASMYATYNKFSDMAGAGWAQGYIGYCANAELVKGYPDGTFKPSGKVTGYEVLAMILRAVGYDKNGEFSGADWALHVAQTAQQAGVLKNVKGIDLNAPATRELVAELLFRAIADASTVNYTPAFGYVTDKVLKLDESTLGYKNFKLEGKADADVFGRPATKWTYNVGDKSTLVVDKPVASYTTKVDECDIAKDLGITSSKSIEKAYIDGASQTITNAAVTTDRNGKIDPKVTTSLVGAQGRLTEVYDMGTAGYRIVEINTYLAKVTKVTDASTDRNGHVTNASINLEVYIAAGDTDTFLNVEAEGFTKNQYVLVTISNPTEKNAEVQSVEAATVTAMGKVKSWTPAYGTTAATTTVADTKYNDADKFVLGYAAKTTNIGTDAYNTVVDAYGNLIGLVKSDVNYLVVEKIEWKHDSSAIGNGKALADLVLATGEKVSGVVVASVNDAATSNTGDSSGAVKTAYVSDSYVNNTAYYNHIYTYSVNADGNYELNLYCYKATAGGVEVQNTMHNTDVVKFTTGKTSTIVGTKNNATNVVVANNNTKFLVKNINSDTDKYSYTVYNGINELPSMTVTQGNLCFLDDGTFATLVVINNYTLASSKFVAYAEKQNGYAVGYNPVKFEYTVYPVGGTEAVKVYADNANLITADGFYQIEMDANDKTKAADVTKVLEAGIEATVATKDYDDLYWENGFTKAFDGDSLVNLVKENGSAFADYRVNSATKYFTVTTTIWNNSNGSGTTQYVEVTASEAANLAADKQVVVAYDKTANGDKVASYIYILKTVNNAQDPEVTTGTVEYKVQFIDQYGNKQGDELELGVQKKSTTGDFSFDIQTVITHAGWQGEFSFNNTTVALVGGLHSVPTSWTVKAGETTTVVFEVIK